MTYNKGKGFRQSILRKADKFTYLIKPVAGILIMFVCIKFTIYLFQDFINVGDDDASLIGGIIFGVILSGVIANIIEAVNYSKAHKAKALTRNSPKPRDGEIYKISGILRPLGTPLLSPFTCTPCVAYKYKITHAFENSDTPATALDANGAALTTSVIHNAECTVNICGYAEFEGFEYPLVPTEPNSELLRNANKYMRETQFERTPVASMLGELKDFYQDTTGEYRFDVKGDFEELNDKQLSEMCVPVDSEVVGIGEYSKALNGLIKGKRGELTIIAGNMDTVQRDLNIRAGMRLKFGAILFLIYFVVLVSMFLLVGGGK